MRRGSNELAGGGSDQHEQKHGENAAEGHECPEWPSGLLRHGLAARERVPRGLGDLAPQVLRPSAPYTAKGITAPMRRRLQGVPPPNPAPAACPSEVARRHPCVRHCARVRVVRMRCACARAVRVRAYCELVKGVAVVHVHDLGHLRPCTV